jgi:mRNA-degrading endonuclease toxin of MazEF toxin-antitoxin module
MPRGDIVLIALPRPVGEAGHEQFGDRPAVIIQEDSATANLSTLVVVPITGSPSATRFPGSLSIRASRGNGLHKNSVAMPHQMLAIDKRRAGQKIGRLSHGDLSALEDSIRQLLGL